MEQGDPFLSERILRVKLEGHTTDFGTTQCGAPQGSPLVASPIYPVNGRAAAQESNTTLHSRHENRVVSGTLQHTRERASDKLANETGIEAP